MCNRNTCYAQIFKYVLNFFFFVHMEMCVQELKIIPNVLKIDVIQWKSSLFFVLSTGQMVKEKHNRDYTHTRRCLKNRKKDISL